MRKRSRGRETVTESRSWWEAVQRSSWMGFRGRSEIIVGAGGNRTRYPCGIYNMVFMLCTVYKVCGRGELLCIWNEVDDIFGCVNLSGTAIITKVYYRLRHMSETVFCCLYRILRNICTMLAWGHTPKHNISKRRRLDWKISLMTLFFNQKFV